MKRGAAANDKRPFKRPRPAGPAPSFPVKKSTTSVAALAAEKKFFDTTFNTDASTTETVLSIFSVGTGDTVLLRDGNKVVPKSCELRILMANEALTQNNTVRFALIQAKQANAAAPTWFAGNPLTDVFDALTVNARRNVASASKFRVILDETIVVNQGSDGALQQAYWHKWVKLPDEITQFADGTAAIAVTNAYFLMYIGSTASGATDLDVTGSTRIRFIG